MKIILASSSPRRRELLRQAGIAHTLRTQGADESSITTTEPLDKVIKLARLKAEHTLVYDGELIITADTIVAHNKKIFEKPADIHDAKRMMTALSGTTHEVHTAVVLKSTAGESLITSTTEVHFYDLLHEEIEAYIQTDEPYDKAGGYGIQSTGAIFVKKIKGDYNTIIGLPLAAVYREIKRRTQ